MWRFVLIFSIACVLCSCGASVRSSGEQSCSAARLTRLYFGSDMPSGQVVEAQWSEFLRSVISPRFRGGLTVLTGQGQWLGEERKLVSETSRVVELVHYHSEQDAISIREIVDEYKQRFAQESVMVLHSDVSACFIIRPLRYVRRSEWDD